MRTNIKSIVIGSLAAVGLIGALSAYKSCNDTSNDTILSEIEYMREKKERKENTLTSLGAAKFIDGEISPWSSTVRLINLNYVTPENDTVRVTLNDNAEDGFLKNNDQEPEQVSIGSPNRSQYFDDLIFCGSGSSCDNNVSDLPISLVERLSLKYAARFFLSVLIIFLLRVIAKFQSEFIAASIACSSIKSESFIILKSICYLIIMSRSKIRVLYRVLGIGYNKVKSKKDGCHFVYTSKS